MIDIKFLRENPDIVKENIKNKFQEQKLVLVDEVIELDKKNREVKLNGDNLRSERKNLSAQIGGLMKNGQKEEAEKIKQQVQKINEELDKNEKLEAEYTEQIKERMMKIPNIMDSSVPLKSVNHMVNKLIVGIVSAGLLMASSLLCTTQMTPKVFGIPALGFIGYITAVGLGIWLLFTVLKERKHPR